MSELRRKDRAVSAAEALALLNRAEYGVLSTVGEDGKPYGVPLSFCVVDRCVYFHGAVEGQKIDNIEVNASVSFCVVGSTEILPGKFSTIYESAIVSGVVEEVFDENKQIGLEGIVRKYSPEYLDSGRKYIEAQSQRTRVFRVPISTLTGKARKR